MKWSSRAPGLSGAAALHPFSHPEKHKLSGFFGWEAECGRRGPRGTHGGRWFDSCLRLNQSGEHLEEFGVSNSERASQKQPGTLQLLSQHTVTVN